MYVVITTKVRVGDEMYNCGLGFIFYERRVVGEVLQKINVIFGGAM